MSRILRSSGFIQLAAGPFSVPHSVPMRSMSLAFTAVMNCATVSFMDWGAGAVCGPDPQPRLPNATSTASRRITGTTLRLTK